MILRLRSEVLFLFRLVFERFFADVVRSILLPLSDWFER